MTTCDAGPCQAVISMIDEGDEGMRFSWTFIYDQKSGQLSSIITLPLGVAIQPGLKIALNSRESFSAPFQVCDKEGCRSVLIVDADLETAFEASESVAVQFVPYGSKSFVEIEVPMAGYSDASQRMKELTAKPAN